MKTKENSVTINDEDEN